MAKVSSQAFNALSSRGKFEPVEEPSAKVAVQEQIA